MAECWDTQSRDPPQKNYLVEQLAAGGDQHYDDAIKVSQMSDQIVRNSPHPHCPLNLQESQED